MQLMMVMMRRRRKEEIWRIYVYEKQLKRCDKPQVFKKMMGHAAIFP